MASLCAKDAGTAALSALFTARRSINRALGPACVMAEEAIWACALVGGLKLESRMMRVVTG